MQVKRGPEPGDLMMHLEHAALVLAVYSPGSPHPKAGSKIPMFPGPQQAARQKNQTEYFRDPPLSPGTPPPASTLVVHIDYLNHRGLGKEKAEIIYNAGVPEMRSQGLQFYKYADSVLDNWTDWNGVGAPPR